MHTQADHVGDIAIVLHTHMPYVEGFGTYPFGEEWLLDAVLRSYVPVLERVSRLTMSVTPVLADQLEAPGIPNRLLDFARTYRLGSARLDLSDVDRELRAACAAEVERFAAVIDRLEQVGGRALELFDSARADGRVELIASAATHAVLPMIATRESRRLQIAAGIDSHRRRFGAPAGFWLPECGYEPGLEELLTPEGIAYFCTDQSALEAPEGAMRPMLAGATTAFTIDWEAIGWLWSLDGYPADPGHADFHRKSLRGTRPWAISGEPYDPAAARDRARRQGEEFAASIAERLRAHRRASGHQGLITFAIDTELLGHWWSEGPDWLEAALPALDRAGVRRLTLSEAAVQHPPRSESPARSTWGEGKGFSTWDSPEVADLAWGVRKAEIRLLREIARGLRGPALERATRELLALQASDWAFLDFRRQAGDYPYERSLGHSLAFFEAIESGDGAVASLRGLAPELSLAPLLEP